jgi:hypothetical protein
LAICGSFCHTLLHFQIFLDSGLERIEDFVAVLRGDFVSEGSTNLDELAGLQKALLSSSSSGAGTG